MRHTFILLGVLLCAAELIIVQDGSTARNAGGAHLSDPQFGQHRNEEERGQRQMERERTKQLNEHRQASLQRDTDKLLLLATQLKEYVDKTNENILSVEVLKKAEEIEKLAHQVREKMKNSP